MTAFAERFPEIEFAPTDVDPACLASISAYIADAGYPLSVTVSLHPHATAKRTHSIVREHIL